MFVIISIHLLYVTSLPTTALSILGVPAMSASSALQSRNATNALWVLRILAAAIFLIAGLLKLGGQSLMVQEFETVGVGQWLRYLTGLLEIIGGLAVLAPSFSALGAGLLLVIDVGAFIAQIAILHMDWIHPIIIGALLGALVYLQRDQIARR
jgi:uncharacterized membrane protein YphA (DoxX/SURF4 family)